MKALLRTFFLAITCLQLQAQTIPPPIQTGEIINNAGDPAKADPGDVIRYKVTITNTGMASGTGVQLNVTPDMLTTFVPGSFKSSPLALPDAYTCTGNVGISVPAGSGVKANDFDDAIASATVAVLANPANGSLTLNVDGSFTYTPNANYTGSDQFTYTLTDGNPVGLPVPLTDVGTVTITVSDLIWFIDNSSVAGTEDGRLNTPFKTIANFSASALPAAGAVIFIKNTGTEYRGGFILKNNQYLFGSGHSGGANLADVLPFAMAANSFTLPAIGGTRPLIRNMGIGSSANKIGILLASGNTIRGVEVGRCEAVKISGSAFGTLTIGNTTNPDVALSGNRNVLDLTNGTFAATSKFVSINSPDSSGLLLNTVSGSLASGSTLIGADGTGSFGIDIQSSSASLDFGTTTVNRLNSGPGVSITNSGTGSVTFGSLAITSSGAGLFATTGGTINIGGTGNTSSGRPALDITSTSFGSGATFASLTSTNFSSKGINLDNVTGSVIANGGSLSSSFATNVAFDVNAGSSTITYAGSISYTGTASSRTVEITGRTGGTVTLSGNITTSAGTGINVASNTGGTIAFSGSSKSLSTGANTAVTLATNTGATINFTNGGLVINTTSGTGFSATGGATAVNVTGTGNTISSSSGATALNVVSTTIGGSGLNFLSISSTGGTVPGINLNTTGSGGLTVTGDGGESNNGSGGSITNKTGSSEFSGTPGVRLFNVSNVRLKYMNITGCNHSGIYGGLVSNPSGAIDASTINGFQLERCNITGNGDTGTSLPDETGVDLYNLVGTAIGGSNPTSIVNCTISGNFEFELQITNRTATALTDLQMSGNTISNTTAAAGHGNLINFLGEGEGAANMKLTLTSGTFTGNAPFTATAVQCDHSGTGGTMTANISGATFTNNNVGPQASVAGGAHVIFNFSNNTVTGNRSTGINVFADANPPFTKSIEGTIQNNTVGTLGVPNSGANLGIGIRVQNEGSIPCTLLITGNTVQEVTSFQGINVNVGISLAAGGQLTAVTATNNIIRNINNSRAIAIQDNATTAPFPTVCANISGNVMSNVAGQAGDGTFVRIRRLNGTFNVTQASLAALEAANTCNAGSCSVLFAPSGTITYGQPACILP